MTESGLTYNAEQILEGSKRFSFHKRALLNAESLFAKQHYKSAIEVYTRTQQRIHDPDIRAKIAKNLEDIQRLISDSNATSGIEGISASSSTHKRKESFDVQQKLKELAEKLASSLSFPSTFPGAENREKEEIRDKTEYKERPKDRSLPERDVESGLNSPFLYEFNTSDDANRMSPIREGEGGKEAHIDTASIKNLDSLSIEGVKESHNTFEPVDSLQTGHSETRDSSASGPAADSNSARTQQAYQESELKSPMDSGSERILDSQSPSQSQDIREETSSPSSIPETYRQELARNKNLPENYNVYNPINELLSSLYFSRDFESFRNLPLKDRRSGKERRSYPSVLPPGIQNRRSGEDRRKVDLFKKRDEYLNEWVQQKKTNAPEEVPQDIFEPRTVQDLFPSGLISPYSYSLPGSAAPPTTEPQDTGETEKPEAESSSVPTYPPYYPFAGLDSNSRHEGVPYTGAPPSGKAGAANEEYIKDIDIEKGLIKIGLPDPINADDYEFSSLMSGFKTISLPDPEDIFRKIGEDGKEEIDDSTKIEETEGPEVEFMGGSLTESPYADEYEPEGEEGEVTEAEAPPEPERTIHGVLELKPPEEDDAPFLTLTYDFTKIPHSFRLSKNYSIMEYSYYKYKPMLTKAQEFARRKMLKNALNYYRVIKSQNIPPELKSMINRNIKDITEFLEKFIMAKGN